MKKMIELNREYTTRCGFPVKLFTTKMANNDYPVAGTVLYDDGKELVESWSATGSYSIGGKSTLDLVETPAYAPYSFSNAHLALGWVVRSKMTTRKYEVVSAFLNRSCEPGTYEVEFGLKSLTDWSIDTISPEDLFENFSYVRDGGKCGMKVD